MLSYPMPVDTDSSTMLSGSGRCRVTRSSLAEVMKDGSLKPYPDQRWNEWRNAKKDEMPPQDHRVWVRSVVADHEGNLWVLDPAAPAQDKVVAGGPKLVKISLVPFRPPLFTAW